jgi:hypothetical protein
MIVICPYCNKEADYVDSKIVYSRSYGMMYYCKDCDAYVGVHKGTDKPFGRLANKELREWKIKAHNAFDPLWKSKGFTRKGAYKYLSKAMNKKPSETHIGMFDVQECKKVINICNKVGAK